MILLSEAHITGGSVLIGVDFGDDPRSSTCIGMIHKAAQKGYMHIAQENKDRYTAKKYLNFRHPDPAAIRDRQINRFQHLLAFHTIGKARNRQALLPETLRNFQHGMDK